MWWWTTPLRNGTLAEFRRVSQGWQNVHLLAQQKNTGFAEGNNIGLRFARQLGATYALLLNQDIEVTPVAGASAACAG